jgi:hypothetical protein
MTVAQVTGSVETASAILALGGTVNESYTATLADMTTGSNAVNLAFEKQAQTADAQFQLMQNAFEDVKITIGNALMPALLGAAEGLRSFTDGVDADTIKNLGKLLFIVASGFGAMKVAALAKDMGGLTGILKGVTGGVKGLNAAIKSNPFGLIASAVATLVAYGPDLLDMMNGVTESQKEFDAVASSAVEGLRKEQAELNLLAEALRNTNPESEERAKYLKRFNELSPVAIKDLKDETKFNGQLQTALNEANKSFAARIKLRAAEAIAQKAAEIQLEEETKSIESRDKLLQSGMGINAKLLDEFAKRVKAGEVNTGFFDNSVSKFFETAKALGVNVKQTSRNFGDVSNMIQQYAESQAKSAEAGEKLANVQKSIAETSKEVNVAVASNTVVENESAAASDNNTKEKEKAKTALEKLNEELGKLKTAQENATFAGNIEKASEYQKAISKLENQLAIFKNKLEEVRGGIVGDEDLEALDRASDLSFDYADKLAKEFGLIASSADLGTFTDEEGIELPVILTIQEKAKQDALKKVGEIESEMGKVFGAVNSVLGPAMDALNGYFDLQLNNLEKEKNQRLANENLTAEERLRIEEEYEAKKNAILAEQFEVGRASQIINATMSAAQAALNAFAATAAIPLIGPGVAAAAAAVAGAFGALQIGIIAAQPNPYKFFEGTPYLQLGGNPKGKDTIPVMAHEGEAIIPTGKNLQYPGLAKSWIDGSLDGYINKNFVRPALMEQQRQAEEDFADRLANSMALQMSSNFDDYRLFRATKEQTAVLRDGFQTMKQTRKKLRGA